MGRDFILESKFDPAGDQPVAIKETAAAFNGGSGFVTLMGVTGSGKTFTVANIVKKLNIPVLVMSHNKTLAAQLASEYRDFFPHNAVEYFVSYYDYYQPEAYVAQKDLYIEKDSSVNEEIDRLRHRATQALMTRNDVLIVASVSAIFGLGSPEMYKSMSMEIGVGDPITRKDIISSLVEMQYKRGDGLERGTFRVRGRTMEICSIDEAVLRLEFKGDRLKSLHTMHPATGELLQDIERAMVFPATHYNIPLDRLEEALGSIERDMEARVGWFRSHDRLLEAQRLEQRTLFDLEMIRETGSCNGIENYSRYFDHRRPGEPPYTLMDFFPERFLLVIDESHVTLPQLRGMYKGDRSRKESLVEYGFRLPSALDNRPLKFREFEKKLSLVLFTSATPGPYERERSSDMVEQVIRPTGLVDPQVKVRPIRGQMEDLIYEIKGRVERKERVLITTLTKRMAEMLSEHLDELGMKVQYLHSDVKTLDRIVILRDLRLGRYDVVVGINLLREGLDLPEVSLVAILDADKEGFLRSETSLIQTIGRAARNVSGTVLMYADNITGSMKRAIDETNRRRRLQQEFNREHGIIPRTIRKDIKAIVEERPEPSVGRLDGSETREEMERIIEALEEEMHLSAAELRFEEAALIRDQLMELKKRSRSGRKA